MIFMDIVSWEPEDSEKVMECYEGYAYPESITVIDEWIDLTGHRIFVIYEVTDEAAYATANLPFMEICRFESIPVMKAERYNAMVMEISEKVGEHKKPLRKKEPSGSEMQKYIEGLEKRVTRLEKQTFIQQEDVT